MRDTTSSSDVYLFTAFQASTPFLPRCCFLSYSFLLRLLALFLRCCSISILFACYLAASYYPSPHPITIVCLHVGLESPRHAQVVLESVILSNLIWVCYLVTASHDTLLLMLVWEITKQDKASVGILSASFGHYALVLLLSPRSDRSCYLF